MFKKDFLTSFLIVLWVVSSALLVQYYYIEKPLTALFHEVLHSRNKADSADTSRIKDSYDLVHEDKSNSTYNNRHRLNDMDVSFDAEWKSGTSYLF